MKEYLNYYEGRKVLVTGGAGAVGSILVRKLLELKAQVIVLDDLSSGYTWNLPQNEQGLLFVQGDVVDEVDLKRVFNEEPQIIFHLAAFFANQNSVDYPEKDLNINGLGTLKLLQYGVMYGKLERLVYASSGCSIYPSDAPMPFKEDLGASMYMGTPYQITKMLGELYMNYFYKMKGLPISKARFFNSYGAGEVPGQYRNVIPNFIYWAMQGQSLPITGTGEETRDFTYVGDIVDGLLRMGYMKEAIGEAFNLAAGKEIKIIDLANKVNKFAGSDKEIRYLPRRKWDTKTRLLASNEKARKVLGFDPIQDFDYGLKETIQWFDTNWDNIKDCAKFGPGISSAVRPVAKENNKESLAKC
ncbi:MAG: NAD-dependent epimerase/dehydratase family protein [Candidatus Omnitrophica bacterium]|nr:NAD-dependent epimerase/dehydratase family protein [Candidatus Omnitrophota bacterium]